MVGLDYGKREESNTWAEGRNGKDSGHNARSKSGSPGEITVSRPAGIGLINDSQIDIHV